MSRSSMVADLLGKVAGLVVGWQVGMDMVGKPVGDAIEQVLTGGQRLRGEVDQVRAENDRRFADQERVARIRRDTAENAARLAAASPQLYTQLLAANHFPQGLPEGSMMIGGEPAFDLVNEVAYMMSQGKFNK